MNKLAQDLSRYVVARVNNLSNAEMLLPQKFDVYTNEEINATLNALQEIIDDIIFKN